MNKLPTIKSLRTLIQHTPRQREDEAYDQIHGDSEGIPEALASVGIKFQPRIETKPVEPAMIPYWLNGQIS